MHYLYVPHCFITEFGSIHARTPIKVHVKQQEGIEVKEEHVLCSDPDNDIAVLCVQGTSTLLPVSSLLNLN